MLFLISSFINPVTKLNDLSVEQLFKDIENSKYKTAKVRNKNLRKYSKYDFLRKIEGFSTEQTHNITTNLMYQMLTMNNIVSLEDISKLSLDPVIENLRTVIKSLDDNRKKKGLNNETVQELNRLYGVYNKILDNVDQFAGLVSDQLRAFNINRKADVFENENGIDIKNTFEDNQDGADLLKYDRASYENSGKDNMLANVKLFIATLPTSKESDPYTRMPKMTDFSEAFSKLMKDVTPARNFKEIITILEQKAGDDIFYKVLLDGDEESGRVGLKNAPNSFKHQFEIAMYKHRHKFFNVVVDPKTGEHNYIEAAVSKAEKELAYEWSLNFYLSGKFIKEDDTIKSNALLKIIKSYDSTIRVPFNRDYAKGIVDKNSDKYLNKLSDILAEVGVNVTPKELKVVALNISRDNKGNEDIGYGLDTLINRTLFGFFGLKEGVFSGLVRETLKEYQRPETLFATDAKIVEFARMVLEGNIYLIDDTILGANFNTYYVYSQPSLLTEYVKDLNQDSQLIKDLQSVEYNKHSRFLSQIADGKKFDVATFASYREQGEDGDDYTNIDSKEDFLLKLNGIFRDLIPLPTLADRKGYYMYTGLERINLNDSILDNKKYTLSDRVIDIFYGYAQDEERRIAKVKEEIKEAKATKDYSKLVQNYHYTTISSDGTPIFTDDAQGLKYRHFTEFNDKKINKASIRSALKDNIQDTIEYAESLGLIRVSRNSKGEITKLANNIKSSSFLDKKLLSKFRKEFKSETHAIYHMMAEYTINTISSTIETEKLITGDPAYYKDVEDKIKRLNAPVAPGEKVIETFTEGEFVGRTQYTTATIRSFKYEDTTLIAQLSSKFAAAYKKLNPTASDSEVEEAVTLRLEPYTGIDVTDAQVFVTPKMYRELKIRMGEWENVQQEAYELLFEAEDKGLILDKDKLLKAQELILQPLKLVHFGQYFKDGNGIPIYDKMSVAILTPDLVKDTPMEAVYNKMIDMNIDMLKYDSAVKVGNTGMIDYFDLQGNPLESNLDNIRPFQQRFKYLRKQQVTDPHVTETRLLGTQVKKVVMANLKLNDAIYTIKGSNKKYTGGQIADMYSKAYSSLSNSGLKRVKKELGIDPNDNIDITKLYNNLRKAAIQGNLPYNIIDSLFVDQDGKPNVQLDTLLNRKWTESRMISTITKYTVDAVTPGTDLIQMSGGGLDVNKSSQLKLLDSKGRTEIKISVSMFKAVIPDYENKSYNQKINWLKKNWAVGFDGIGYRIPTQGQNSTVPFIIKEFLPESYGNTIILPYGFTALTGSDFDIDKLFIARYNYYTVGDKAHKVVFYDGNEEGIIEDEKTLENIWKQTVLPKLVYADQLKLIKNRIDQAANQKEALLNYWNNVLDTKTKVDIAEELGYLNITQDTLDQVGSDLTPEVFEKQLKETLALPSEKEFIESNKGKDAFELNSTKAVQNRLLDLMFSVLTNEDHILETKTPLDTFTSKLKDMAAVVKSKEPLTMLQSAAPSYQLQVKNWYIGGGKGIGPFALNNVHHALTQITGYNITFGNMTYNLNGQVGDDGINIIDWLSALINAHVDIAKDPYIFHLNVHKGTYDIVNLLIRAGYGEQTFWLINQESVKSDIKDIDYYRDEAIKLAKTISQDKEEQNIRLSEIEDTILKYSDPGLVLSDQELKDYITTDNKDYIYYAKQAGIISAYFEINEAAATLSNHVLHSRIDNKGFGKTLGELQDFNKKFEELMLKSPEFAGLINNTFLKTLYDNSIPLIRKLYSGLSIEATGGFSDIMGELGTTIGVNPEAAAGAVYSAIVAQYFTSPKGYNLTKEDIRNLFRGKTSVGYRLRDILNKHPELKDNRFINTLKYVYDGADNVWFVKALSGDKNDKFMRDSYSEGWADLLEHPNNEIRKLAEDLVFYSFYTSGFNRSLYSFYQDLPISHLLKRPNHSDKSTTLSYDEFIKETIATLSELDLSDDYRRNIVEQALKVFRHNKIPYYKGAVPKAVLDKDDNVSLFKLDKGSVEFLGNNAEGSPLYTNMYRIKYKGNIVNVEYVGYKTDSKEVIYRVIPNTGISYKGHKILELGYEGSIFDEGYRVVNQELLQNTLPSVEGWQDFVYVSPYDKLLFETSNEVSEREEQAEVKGGSIEKGVELLVEETDIIINLPNSMQEIVNHSGGAKGADTIWDSIGREYGMTTTKHYYVEGEKTPKGNTMLTKEEAFSADVHLKKANKTLYRKFPTSNEYVNNLLRRNWYQVKNSDAIFAIGRLDSPIRDKNVPLNLTDPTKSKYSYKFTKVKGGTGWAVQMAIDNNKPVYVFDLTSNTWVKWVKDRFIDTTVPVLTKNFAGIGTRELTKENIEGISAIRNVYKTTKKFINEEKIVKEQIQKFKEFNYFEGLTSLQESRLRSLLSGLPQEWAQDKEIRNAIINGDREETKRVIEQKKKCE